TALPDSLVIREEEQAVLENGTSKSAAELVLAKIGLGFSGGICKKLVRIERTVTEKFEQVAVKLVCPAAGLHIDHAAHRAPKLGREVAGGNLEFLDGVDHRQDDDAATVPRTLVVVDAVKNIVVVP